MRRKAAQYATHLRYAARLLSHGGGRHELVLTSGRSAPVGRACLDALRASLARKGSR